MYVFPVGMVEYLRMLYLCRSVLMSSAYVVSIAGACGIGVSYVYVLNNVDERTPMCGTLVLNWRYVDVFSLNVV